MITITCNRPPGLWRAGVYHPAGPPVVFDDSTFDEAQLQLLQAEPLLDVVLDTGADPDPFADQGPMEGDKAGKIEILVAALSTMPLDDQTLTSNGSPQVQALAKAAGVDVTADERDAAWAAWQEKTTS